MRLKLSTICPTCKKTLTPAKTVCDTIALNAGSRLDSLGCSARRLNRLWNWVRNHNLSS